MISEVVWFVLIEVWSKRVAQKRCRIKRGAFCIQALNNRHNRNGQEIKVLEVVLLKW